MHLTTTFWFRASPLPNSREDKTWYAWAEIAVDSITTNTTINKTDGQFDVEYNVKDYSDSDDYRLLKINTKTIKKRTYYFMTYEDLATVEYRRPISVEIRPKTVKTIYKIPTDGAGTYALYDSRKMEAIILKVE